MSVDLAHVHEVLRTALDALLTPLADGGMHWQRAQLPPAGASYVLPMIVAGVTDDGTVRRYFGGGALWRGPASVRCVATDLAGAETLARAVAAALPASSSVADPAGGAPWTLALRMEPPRPATPGASMAEVHLVVSVALERG